MQSNDRGLGKLSLLCSAHCCWHCLRKHQWGNTSEQGLANLGEQVVLSSYEHCLYLPCFNSKQLKVLIPSSGILFNMDGGSSAQRNFTKYLTSRRSFGSLAAFGKYVQKEEA